MKKCICEACKKPVSLRDSFCGHCGSKFLLDADNEIPKSAVELVGNWGDRKASNLEITPETTVGEIEEFFERTFDRSKFQFEKERARDFHKEAEAAYEFGEIVRGLGKVPVVDKRGALYIVGSFGWGYVGGVRRRIGDRYGWEWWGEGRDEEYDEILEAFRQAGWDVSSAEEAREEQLAEQAEREARKAKKVPIEQFYKSLDPGLVDLIRGLNEEEVVYDAESLAGKKITIDSGLTLYELLEDGIPCMNGDVLKGPGDNPTPAGSFFSVDREGDVQDIWDNLGNGVFDRGPSISDLSENEQTDLEYILGEGTRIKKVSRAEANRGVKLVFGTY